MGKANSKIAALFFAAIFWAPASHAAAPKQHDIRDATSLAQESVMTSKIDQAVGNTPLGSIVAYPNVGNISAYVSDDYIECDGRAVPVDSDLYKKKGITRTPNLYVGLGASGKGYFLRAGATPQQTSADKFESHLHGQPQHTHEVTGGLLSTAVSANLDSDKVEGTAAPQEVTYKYTWFHWGPSSIPIGGYNENGNWVPVGENTHTDWQYDHSHSTNTGSTGSAGGHQHNIVYGGGGIIGPKDWRADVKESKVTAKVNDKHSSGRVVNGAIEGTAHSSGGDDTYKTGDDETAPTYYTVRYFMRINE